MKALTLISSLLVTCLVSFTWVDVSGDAQCGDHGRISTRGCCICDEDWIGVNEHTLICPPQVVVQSGKGPCNVYCQWEGLNGTICGISGTSSLCHECLDPV